MGKRFFGFFKLQDALPAVLDLSKPEVGQDCIFGNLMSDGALNFTFRNSIINFSNIHPNYGKTISEYLPEAKYCHHSLV